MGSKGLKGLGSTLLAAAGGLVGVAEAVDGPISGASSPPPPSPKSFCHFPEAALAAKHTITISPSKMDPGSPNTILLCTAMGFYPSVIDIQWLKNRQPEKEGVAFGEELQNGDWTCQLQMMLETQPKHRDVYACKVGHASLEAPIIVQWESRSFNSGKSKLWKGTMGAVLGVVFLAVGLLFYLKNKMGYRWGVGPPECSTH
ncbi:HLA class II histocompatibility antigen, DR beta 4 chain-like [Liasis olivaceus]